MPARAVAMSAWQASRNCWGLTVSAVEAPGGIGAAAATREKAAAAGKSQNFTSNLLGVCGG